MRQIIKKVFAVVTPKVLQPDLKRAYDKIRYFGSRYRCPLCHSNLARFLPMNASFPVIEQLRITSMGRRESAFCPVCGANDRERLVYLYLCNRTDMFNAGVKRRLLHVAPEAQLGGLLRRSKNLEYLAADLYPTDDMVRMDITDIQLPDKSFDVIICNHVLEHIIDDRKAMAELFRVLKPAGWGILQVPMSRALNNTYEDFSITSAEAREQAFGQADHVRVYAMDYVDRLKQAGFKVSAFGWEAEPDKFGGDQNVYGLNADELVYFVEKQWGHARAP